MVNDHFTLVFIINSGFLVLVPENSYLAFNIPYTSPKTSRVYFGVLQNPWLPYVTKIKFKGKLTKVLYVCMVYGKGIGFFFIEGREE